MQVRLILIVFFSLNVLILILALLLKRTFIKYTKLSFTLYSLLLFSTGGLLFCLILPPDIVLEPSSVILFYYLLSVPICLINIEMSFICKRSFTNIYLVLGVILLIFLLNSYSMVVGNALWVGILGGISCLCGSAVFCYYLIAIIGRWLRTKRSVFENEELLFLLVTIVLFYSGYIFSVFIRNPIISILFLSTLYVVYLCVILTKIYSGIIPFTKRGENSLGIFMPVNLFSSDDQSDKDDPFELIKNQLLDYFEKSKPYLKDNLKIDEVALALMTNKTYLSRTLNMKMSVNFNQFINYFRIKESMQLYLDDRTVTVKEMCHRSGFSNIASFTHAFKINSGRTPAEWCREVRSNHLNGGGEK